MPRKAIPECDIWEALGPHWVISGIRETGHARYEVKVFHYRETGTSGVHEGEVGRVSTLGTSKALYSMQ